MSMQKARPIRTCVGCGEKKDKSTLMRVVRSTQGDVFLDISGRANGRGVYLCRSSECLSKACRSRALERSLKMKIEKEVYDQLQRTFAENAF